MYWALRCPPSEMMVHHLPDPSGFLFPVGPVQIIGKSLKTAAFAICPLITLGSTSEQPMNRQSSSFKSASTLSMNLVPDNRRPPCPQGLHPFMFRITARGIEDRQEPDKRGWSLFRGNQVDRFLLRQ